MDVSEALVRELKEQKYTAGIVQPYIVNLANQWFNSRWHTPYCVNSEELGAANRVCDGRIVSTYQKTHDHAPSRIVEDYVQRGVLCSHLQSYDHILFIGSTYKEVLKWTRLLPNSQISGLLGTFDAKDEMRHELGRVYAKRDLLSTDPITRAVASDYLTFLNTGVANRTFVHASTTSIVPTVDCLVGLDVVYDISTQEWARYLQMYSGKFFYITLVKNVDVLYTKNSVVPDMCLEFVQTEPDWNYALTKNTWETLIMMRHTKGKSNGYVHKRSNYEPWVMCNFHDVQRNFTRTCWAMETIKACSSYEAMRGCKVVEQNWDVYRSLNDAGAGFIEIFDVVQWLLYRRYVPFVIEKKKGEALFHFCIRVSPDSYEPTKIASYMVNLMSRMIVNGAEIQSSWNIDSPLSIKALLFYLTYAAVVRGSMYKAVGRAIKSSQLKEGGSYDYWFIAKLRVLYHFVTGETRRVLQPIMEDCIYKTPRYLHEWHDGYYTSNPRMAPCVYNSMQEGNDVFDAASKLKDFPKRFTTFFKHAFGPLHVKKVDIDPEELGQMLAEVSEKDIEKWQEEHPVEPYVPPKPSAPIIDFSLPPSVSLRMEKVGYTPAVAELTAILMDDGRKVSLVPADPVPAAPRLPDPLGVPCRKPLPVPVKKPVVVDWGTSDFGERYFFDSMIAQEPPAEPQEEPEAPQPEEDIEEIVKVAEPDPQEDASAPAEEEDDRENSKNLCKDGSVFHGSFNQAMNLDMSSLSRICSYASKILRISPELIRVDLLKNGCLPSLPAWDPRDRLKHQLRHLPFLSDLKGDSFLDVGGGDAGLAEHLSSKFKVSLCVDPAATPGKYAIAKKIQEVGGSFEVVLANMSLHHFGGITAVNMLANRVSPGGFLVIREHDLTHIEARALDIVHKAYSDDCGRTQYVRRPTLLKRLEELGFLVVKEKIGTSPLADFTVVACKMGQASDGTCGFSMPQEKAAMLLEQYKNHQFLLNVKKEYDNYQDLHKEVDEAIKNLQPLKDYSKVDVTFWDKTAGARKTQEFLNLYDPNKDLYICHSAELLAEWHEDCKKAGKSKHLKPRELPAKTFEKALSLKNLASRRYIMLDECFQYPVAYQVTLFTLAPQAKFILGGHSLQSEWNWEGFFTEDQRMTTHLKYYTKCKKSDTTYRFAENHSAWLRACPLKVPIWTSPDFVGPEFKLRVLKFGSEDKGLPSFVLSEKGQRHLASMNIVATSVRVRQGFSKPAFNWYITPQCLGMLNTNSLMFVAFTRAKEYLNVVYLPGTEGALEQRGYQMPNIQMLTEQALGMAIPSFDNIPYEGKTPLVAPQPKPAHGKFDGAALRHALFGVVGDLKNVQEAYTSVLDEQVFVEQWAFAADKLPTQRHVEEKRISSSAFGKIFKHSSPKQNIATMLMRNANNAKLIKMKDIEIADWSKFSERFWKLFVKEDIEIGLETQLLAQSLQAVYKKYIAKFGPEAISLENTNVDDKFPPGIEPFLAVIRGHLKDISKVRGMGAAWLAKHGQEISAWATAFNGAFCAYFRTLQEKFISMLKPQFIYAANKSDDQIAEQFANMPDHKFTMTRDWEFYDTNMNKLTQELEAHGMEAMFKLNSRTLFDELCGGMTEISAFVKIYRHESKASGRPDTFFSNTYLGMMFSAFLVASLVGGAWAGDDALELCDAAESDVVFLLTKAMKDLNIVFPSTFKLETTPIPEFCGHLWSGKHYFYDPVRVAIKLICRRWSTERNYEEYKLAVRDHLKVWLQDQSSVERLTALYHGTTKEHMEALIFQLHSFVEGSTWKEFSREIDKIWVTY